MPSRRRRPGGKLAPWLRRLLWLRHRRHSHRRGWVRQRSLWRRSPLQRLLRRQLRQLRRQQPLRRWGSAALRRPRTPAALEGSPLGQRRLALGLAATPRRRAKAVSRPRCRTTTSPLPAEHFGFLQLASQPLETPLQRQRRQRLRLLTQLRPLQESSDFLREVTAVYSTPEENPEASATEEGGMGGEETG